MWPFGIVEVQIAAFYSAFRQKLDLFWQCRFPEPLLNAHSISYSDVEKAYDIGKKFVKSVRSRPPLPAETNSTGI